MKQINWMNRTILLFGAIIAAHALIENDGSAQVARSVESLRASSLRLEIKRAGKSEKMTAAGTLSGAGVRFEQNQGVTAGSDKFIQHKLSSQDWTPVELSFPLLSANEYAIAVDLFPHTLSVSGVEISVPKISANTANAEVTVKSYRPGRPVLRNVTFTIEPTDREIAQKWFQSAKEGEEARKDITIGVRAKDKNIRTFILYSATPVQWTVVDARTQTVEVAASRIEISGEPSSPLLSWLSATILGNDWRATVRCELDQGKFAFADSFLLGYAVGKLERGEVRETWSLQPGNVSGLL